MFDKEHDELSSDSAEELVSSEDSSKPCSVFLSQKAPLTESPLSLSSSTHSSEVSDSSPTK